MSPNFRICRISRNVAARKVVAFSLFSLFFFVGLLAGLGDGSSPESPSFVGSYSSSTYLDFAIGIAYDAANGYVYVTAMDYDAVTIIKVGDPLPTALPTMTPSPTVSIAPTSPSPTTLAPTLAPSVAVMMSVSSAGKAGDSPHF